ncbi:MAG: PP2C family protein-serine/threonine phosphatase [Gammaproteobacteria bacterium]
MLGHVAEVSLLGNRKENQDRVSVARSENATLLIAIDGMGGHADGAKAAELAVDVITKAFMAKDSPVFDPQGFLHLAIGQAHASLVDLGTDMVLEQRPRATCALCLIQDDAAYWAHIGDSRIYHVRNKEIFQRSRDHSHVEVLLEDGVITQAELADHPMRNYVESCMGGNAMLPGMSISVRKPMRKNDLMLVCTDGFWSPLDDGKIAALGDSTDNLSPNLHALGEMAVRAASPHSDNTSAAAFQWQN